MNCPKHLVEHKTLLKNNSLKATPPRLELLDILEHSKKPLSIKEFVDKVKTKNIDTATIYRNMASLAELGLVHVVNLNNKEAYFELASRKHHHHLICEKCGKIADVENCKVSVSDKAIKNSGFASINHHSLEFFGLCQNCQNK